MPIVEEIVRADPAKLVCDATLNVSGADLTIPAMSVVMNGEAADLPEATYTATSRANPTDVVGWIVKRDSDDVIMYLIDEIEYDGVDDNYSFKSSPYTALFPLFEFRMPATTTDIEAQTIKVRKISPTEE